MNPHTLVPSYTVRKSDERINANHPVRVFTHLFEPHVGAPPLEPDAKELCGLITHVPHRREVEPHDHEHYEISLVTSGSAVHSTPMHTTRIGRGSMRVVARGKVHAFHNIDRLVIVNCAYMTEWLFHDLRDLWTMEGLVPMFLATDLFADSNNAWIPQVNLTEEEFESACHELRDLGRECEKEEPALPYLKWCLEKLMVHFARAFARTSEYEAPRGHHREVQHAMEQVEEYILECKPFNVGALAESVGMSADYFSRVFKQATGASPMDYFQQRRVQHASWLLIHAQQSITEVAHSLGFCDSAHFSHVFKACRGFSPSEFRRRYAVQ